MFKSANSRKLRSIKQRPLKKLLEKLEDKPDNLDTEPVWPNYPGEKTLTACEK